MKIALLTGVVLTAVAFNSLANEFVVEGGTGIDTSSPATRLSIRIPTKWEWLTVETGALMTNGGGIMDVTPMARLISISKNASIEAGIGLGGNFINNSGQSQGLIFRDVIRFNYKQYFVEGAHYSNGGKFNPVFGTSDNGGYSYLMGGVRFKF